MSLLIFLLLSECLVQFSDAQRMENFDFGVTISAINQDVEKDCNYNLINCTRIKEVLCELSNFTLPSEMYKSCSAYTISGHTQGGMKWNVRLSLQTKFPNGPDISLTCRTFSELFNVSFIKVPLHALDPPFQVKVESFNPPPAPYDPSKATDAKYKVDSLLCDGDYKPISASLCKNLNNSYLMHALKDEMLISNLMGSFLFSDGNVTLTNLIKSVKGESCSLSLIVELPQSYVKELRIDPSCDVAGILKLSFDDAPDSTFTLCGAKVTATAMASTLGCPLKMLAFSLAISYILANI